ncbi:MAG: hypothetical protein U1F98_04715 [Verrucomicrobiota bacterium]
MKSLVQMLCPLLLMGFPVSMLSAAEPATPPVSGRLQVYSSRELLPIQINGEEFFWNNDYGRNDFLRRQVHTDYRVTTPRGELVRTVRNRTRGDSSTPAVITLPAGDYRIEAKVEELPDRDRNVVFAVRVLPEATVQVRLDQPAPSQPAFCLADR